MTIRTLLLGSAAFAVLASPAFADEAAIEKRLDDMQRMLSTQQQQIESQKAEIGKLRKALGKRGVKLAAEPEAQAPPAGTTAAAAPPALETRMTAEETKVDALVAKMEAQNVQARQANKDEPKWSFANGRPAVTSGDGRFSLAIRTLAQYDTAYYMQGARAQLLSAANGPDLSSGGNFRRVYLGIQGVVFGDWAYNFNYDFGGSNGTETPGHIQSVYTEFDGLKPFAVRIGAFPPSASLEDNTSPADTPFLERNSPADVARNIAGGDGRDAISLIYGGDNLYGALSYTGDKIADTGVFDEQQALVSRLSYMVSGGDDMKAVISGNGTYVFKAADAALGGNSARPITLSDPPELTVDTTGTKLVSTGTLNAESVSQWGVEGALQWQSVYGQAGYFGYDVDQRGTAPSYDFSGWYAEATFVLTGESRNYNAATASFTNPKPHAPFSLSGDGWGAWEVAARYSDLDLNDNAGTIGKALPADGIRGGDQRILSAALNWYPNPALKFSLQFQNVDISRIGTFQTIANQDVGQTFNTVAFRSQISF
jgi:phosphate-selective porin OprO/OprP